MSIIYFPVGWNVMECALWLGEHGVDFEFKHFFCGLGLPNWRIELPACK